MILLFLDEGALKLILSLRFVEDIEDDNVSTIEISIDDTTTSYHTQG